MMIRLAVSGARGRMGSRILALASQDSAFKVTAALETSDHPDLAKWLMDEGIESLSLNPDTVVETWLYLAREAANASKG